MFLSTLKGVINDNWPIITIFIVTLVSLRYFYIRTHREKVSFYKEVFLVFAICYIFLLFSLLTKVELNQGSGYNLIPFTEIFRYEFGSKLFMYNVLGNILSFVIFGIIISAYIKPKTVVPSIVISLIVSTTVEFVQLNIGRSFDVDDIILNCIGGLIGYLLFIGVTAIRNHLPRFFQKDGILNVISVILIALLVIYLLRVMGVFVF